MGLFSKKEKKSGFAPVNAEVASIPTMKMAADFSYQLILDYGIIHERLAPLLGKLAPVSNTAAALTFMKSIGVDKPNEFTTARDLFRSLVSLVSMGADSFRAWYLTYAELGSGVGSLAVRINASKLGLVYFLVCVKLANGNYMGYYVGEDITEKLGLPK